MTFIILVIVLRDSGLIPIFAGIVQNFNLFWIIYQKYFSSSALVINNNQSSIQ
jgi:hypothetical protein